MVRALPIGIQDFKKVRDGGYLYVDKTDMISQILTHGHEVYLYTRPRRFGKSLNLSMLDAFLNLRYPEDNTWFDGLKVSECRECIPHRNTYPVIHFDFKDLDATSYEEFLEMLRLKLSGLYGRYDYLESSEQLNRMDRMNYESIFACTADASRIGYSLRSLSDMLFKHHGRKIVILLDEYDNPIHNAYGKAHQQAVLNIMRVILSSALKGNESLAFGVVTGVMQIAKESIFSGLNNLKVNNVFSNDFDEMFGFTDDEVRAICREYGHPERFDEAREWYDGYKFGNTDIYNPWSLLNYVDEGFRPDTYWAGTSGNSILDDLLDSATPDMWDEFRSLAEGIPVTYEIDPAVTFQDLHEHSSNIYSMLVMSGYLTSFDDDGLPLIRIPNGEMSAVFGKTILKKLSRSSSIYVSRLSKAFIEGDTESIRTRLYDLFASSAGTAMLNDEHSYQAFITGMLMFLFGRYTVKADFEEGNGRYDIRLQRRFGNSPNVVIEIKRIPTDSSDAVAESSARGALEQIHDRDYLHGLEGTTHLYGLSFRNKKVTVVSETLELRSGNIM